MRILVLLAALAGLSLPARAEPPLIVLELFTSQGCTSCPPADALLEMLADEPGLLPLSLHVDYWDYLGWKDIFARPENTQRQKRYAKAVKARSLYTPQMIVNGADRVPGSDEAQVRMSIAAHRIGPDFARVTLRPGPDAVEVEVRPTGAAVILQDEGVIHLVTYDRPIASRIEDGENKGRTITYVNVVRDWLRLGTWDGAAARTYQAPLPGMGRGMAVIVQDGTVGPVLAAARLEP